MEKTNIIKDLQSCQKHIGSCYYSAAAISNNPNLKMDLLSFAREELDIVGWLNYELDEKDIAPTQYASESQVKDAYQKYSQQLN